MAHHPLKLLLRRDHIRWSGGPQRLVPTRPRPIRRRRAAAVQPGRALQPLSPGPVLRRLERQHQRPRARQLPPDPARRLPRGPGNRKPGAGRRRRHLLPARPAAHADARRRPPAAPSRACSRWNRASPMAPAWPAASSNSVPGWTACWPTPCPIICYCAPATRAMPRARVFQLILDETADPAASPLVLERLTDLLIFFMLRHLAARDPQAHGLLVLARDPAMAGCCRPSWPSRRCPGACRTWPTGCTCPRPPSTAVSRCTAAPRPPSCCRHCACAPPAGCWNKARASRKPPSAWATSRRRPSAAPSSAPRAWRPRPAARQAGAVKRTGRPFPPQDRPSSRAEN